MVRADPKPLTLSVVVPLHDEEANVAPLVDELLPVVRALDPAVEILLVDDGSRDATAARIEEARSRHRPHVRHVSLGGNMGQTAALDAGFRLARGDVVVMMDGDLQVDPADIPPMVARIGEYDVVHGWRRDRRDTAFKRLQTAVANRVRNLLTRSSIRDTGCPLKVFRREVVRAFKLYTGLHRFLVTLARLEGFSTLEVPIRHRPRRSGRSKYGALDRLFRTLRDLLAVRWMMARHYRLAPREITDETP